MAWSSLAANQMVSFTDAQGGGFIRNNGQSEVTSNQCMTKSDAFTKYLLTASSSTNALASNQLMEKDYWVADTCNRSTMTVAFWYTNVYGWSGISSPQLGSMTDNSAVIADPAGAVFSTIHFNSTYGWLNFSLNTSSTTIVPTGWTSLTIGSHTYPRTSFSVTNDGLYWQYSLTLQYDPIGTTVGSQVAVQLCNSTFAADTTAPTAPTNLIASAITTTTLTLTWTASTDNIGVDSYLVYQNGVLVATVLGNTTFRNITGLTGGTTYNFTVYAKDGAGNTSLVSNTANVTTLAARTQISLQYGTGASAACNTPTGTRTCYMDTTAFSTATVLYAAATGSTLVASSYYSDTSIVRNFTGGVLAGATTCVSCLVEGTLITLSDGTKVTIEELMAGQVLQSASIDTLVDTNNVNELYKWNSPDLLENRVDAKISKVFSKVEPKTIIINNGLLEATPQHSQLVKRNGVWQFMPMEFIVSGDMLYDSDKNEIEVISVVISYKPKTVYPLTLNQTHTYFANGILTHNIK